MKKTGLIVFGAFIFAGTPARAETYKSCQSEIAIHKFIDCENGLDDQRCRSEKEVLGSISVNLTVNSASEAGGDLVFENPLGTRMAANLECALTAENGDANDMECVSDRVLSPAIGRLVLSFNSFEAPYYVVAFTEESSKPNGAFSTAEDCKL